MALSIKKAGRVCVSSSCSSCRKEGPFFSVESTETSAGEENSGKDLTFDAARAKGNPFQDEFTSSEETSSVAQEHVETDVTGQGLMSGCSDLITDGTRAPGTCSEVS